jgi:uncharacterized protein (TIGR02145 family)
MKIISTLAIALNLLCNLTIAQDSMYIYKSGIVVTKRAVTDIDSIVFYNVKTTFQGKTVIDVEGNFYQTITIGAQTWMAENLKTTKYNDGTDIPNITNTAAWDALHTGACSDYNNIPGNSTIYGKLYNYYAVANIHKLCPTGWHVPTDAEWTTLENYLIANGFNYDGTTDGNKIGKALASDTGWASFSSIGKVGNTDFQAKRNATGFTALPGGYRFCNGDFNYIGIYGGWWSSSEGSPAGGWSRSLYYGDYNLLRYHEDKPCGFSVRCIKDF